MKPNIDTFTKQILVGISSLAAVVCPAQPCWPQFRGPNSQGVVETANPPVHFNVSSNVVWSTATPSGHSSPCIWGQRIFLTSFEEGKLETHAYDRAAGKRLWQKAAPAERIERVQPFNSPASSTPVANAERVIGYFPPFWPSWGACCMDAATASHAPCPGGLSFPSAVAVPRREFHYIQPRFTK